MKKYIIPFVMILGSLFIFRYIISVKKYEPSSMPMGENFNIVKAGKSISLSDFKGKVVALYFGFTYCPDVCPTMLSTLSSISKKLPIELRDQFQIIFITVDPQRDDQDKIDKYTAFFDPKIIALSTNVDKTREIAKSFGVNFKKFYPQKDSSNYVIDHTTYAVLIGKNNQVSDFIPHGEDASIIKETILKALKE